ncbi:MAG: DUF3500 domain-containing protein [Planctomycetota bacterium]|nr:MAG: DUF3500 domain-containing protein [Planctomycetota bacterium]
MRMPALHPLALLSATCCLAVGWLSAQGTAPLQSPVEAARSFLAGLPESALSEAQVPFDAPRRSQWAFVPGDRKGLRLKDMGKEQRDLAHQLLRSSLSSQGYLKAGAIMSLESTLRQLEERSGRRADHRDPELYWWTVFGRPGEGPWAWKVEGHHLSLNFSFFGNEVVAATPLFLGSNPAIVPDGPQAGWQVLAAEQELGLALFRSLNPNQQAKARIADQAPADIASGPGTRLPEKTVGLAASDLTAGQERKLQELIQTYLDNLQEYRVNAEWRRIKRAGWDKIHFAWAGGDKIGEAHYYRIHGPTFLIEYDNIQNGANHVHTIWHDPKNDFGRDWLRRHYQESHSPAKESNPD